jgi:hypothetical protein
MENCAIQGISFQESSLQFVSTSYPTNESNSSIHQSSEESLHHSSKPGERIPEVEQETVREKKVVGWQSNDVRMTQTQFPQQHIFKVPPGM